MVVAAGYVWQTDHAVEQVFASHDATTAMPGTVGSEVPGVQDLRLRAEAPPHTGTGAQVPFRSMWPETMKSRRVSLS